MWNAILVRKLAVVSLFVVPSCACGVEDSGDLPVPSGVATAAITSRVCPEDTPADLAPPADQDLGFVLDAAGFQRYSCNGATWTFVAPQADLFDRGGSLVGTHYAGPTWEYEDGSTVVGKDPKGVIVDPMAIPWLLLSVKEHGDTPGKLSKVSAMQRLETVGGLAPATGCDPEHLGDVADVPYTASYFFYRTRPNHQEGNTRCGATP